MRKYLLDTGSVGHLMSRTAGVYERTQSVSAAGNRVETCIPVIGEIKYGIEYGISKFNNHDLFRRHCHRLIRWPFSEEAAEEYGRIAAHLRRTGRRMQVPDIQIAAIAKTLGKCTVVTTDSDLSAIPGLDVENWAMPATVSSPGT